MEQQKGKNNVSSCVHWGGVQGQREEAAGKLLPKLLKDTSL